MNTTALKAIVIDDNPDDILLMSRLLRKFNGDSQISSAFNGKDALVKLKEETFDIIFLDLRMPDISGLDLLKQLEEGGCRTPVIIITGQGDEKAAVNAMKAGAYDYLVKDELDYDLLNKTLFHALENKRLEEEKERLEKEVQLYTNNLEKIVGERTAEIEYLNNYKELILSTLHEFIRVVDPYKRVIQYESQKVKSMFGDNIGKACYSFWGREDECENCVSRKAIEEGHVTEKEEADDGREYHVMAIPLRNRDGSMSAIEVITDITEKKKMEVELERSKKFAVTGEISAQLAHEIRNPIHKIKMGTGFLRETVTTDANTADILDIISNAANSLEQLVINILDFSRPLKPNWEKRDLISLLGEVWADAVLSAQDNDRIRLEKELPEKGIESWIDPVKFKSIVKNLLANGIQAIDKEGKVKLSVSLKDGNTVAIKISDTGKGIPDKEIQKIFDPYFTTKAKGTGLGMSIVARFVEMHRGTITVKSKIEKGTEVSVAIPVMGEQPEAA